MSGLELLKKIKENPKPEYIDNLMNYLNSLYDFDDCPF